MLKRAAAITIGLIVAGAIVGALCAMVALIPFPLQHWFRPTPDDELITLRDLAGYAAVAGALTGGIAGPLIAWGFLRHVPLWRVIVDPMLGTLIGATVGWLAVENPWVPGIPAILGCSVTGMIVAAVLLRVRVSRSRMRSVHEAAT